MNVKSTSRASRASAPPSVQLLGVRIDCLRRHELMDRAVRAAREGRELTIGYVNIHAMNVQYRDALYRRILTGMDLVYCDGTGVRLAARLARQAIPERMTGADWIWDLCRAAAEEQIPLFLLGSGPGVAARAVRKLCLAYPRLKVVGTEPGYALGPDTVRRINESGAKILLVGLGTPTQEKWVREHREEIETPVIWVVGALFEFVSGSLRRGPNWMTDHGLEWVCRLALEPRKLWRRYLIGNPLFLWRIIRYYWLP